MELPRPLTPWGPYLELLPVELATALGPLIQRLDLVIGPLQASGRYSEGDPDGFNGITRRGNYERLLISEWMLADEFPEEFARRAVMGELGFLELARRQPAGGSASVALFDAGPDQLGGPRIAHLAALIVLARRAEGTGACFQWGMLQQPAGTLLISLTAGTLGQLFQARSYSTTTDRDIAAWREHVGSQVGADDIWLIGGSRLNELPAARGASLLQITDPYLPEANHLNAVVTDRGRIKPTVTLELPPPADCTRLLRDPFTTRRAAPSRTYSRFAPTSNLVFLPGGNRLMARAGTDHIIVYPIPNAPHMEPGKPRIYHTEGQRPILAAGCLGRSLALLTMEPLAADFITSEPESGKRRAIPARVVQIEYVGPRSRKYATDRFYLPLDAMVNPPKPTDPLALCYAVPGERPNDQNEVEWQIVFNTRLLRLVDHEHDPEYYTAAIEMESIMAASGFHGGCVCIGMDPADPSEWVQMSILRGGNRHVHRKFDRVLSAHFGYGAPQINAMHRIAAIEQEEGVWTIVLREAWRDRHSDLVLQASPKTRVLENQVLGVVALSGEDIPSVRGIDFQPGLILMSSVSQRIRVMGENWMRSVPSASSPIVQFAANPYGPEIAYLTEKGELVVYSLQQEAVLCRFMTGETP